MGMPGGACMTCSLYNRQSYASMGKRIITNSNRKKKDINHIGIVKNHMGCVTKATTSFEEVYIDHSEEVLIDYSEGEVAVLGASSDQPVAVDAPSTAAFVDKFEQILGVLVRVGNAPATLEFILCGNSGHKRN
ncbi:hypothetical protein AMTR_s00007p00260010 [Amborella trichopoda]|uniref:Uncharacterized protein n=1 Tax=Amborella trichopoda TaxID=13333 RepID=W1PD04_AMBTC|nr:hypothetical protein AMTR_s00007p00260010 [Amborella trichopoda]